MKKNFFLFVMLCAAQIGFAQLKVDAAGNTLVSGNIYIGGASKFLATTGDTPLVFKVNNSEAAGSSGNQGNSNVSFGYGSLSNPTGAQNTAIGYYALYSNTTGYYNTANGYRALYNNTEGNTNTANGTNALFNNTTGHHNTANGYHALHANTTGRYNTANGIYALRSNTDGLQNTATGFYALRSNTIGNYNTAIGTYADVSANNLTNATAIGHDAIATASNQVRIGNSSVTSIGGYTTWTNISDGRAKKNIRTDVPGLNFINSLQPVTYNLDLDAIDKLVKSDDPEINRLNDSLRAARSSEEKEFETKSRAAKQKQVQTGFVAQDVEKTAKSIGYDFSGVDVDEKGIYGLRYAEFVVPLVKAVQELSEKNITLQEQVNELIEGMKKQQDIINDMKAACCAPELRSADEIGDNNKGGAAIAVTEQAKLFQNTPNPFNQTTEIGYFIPETVGSANIYIYDVNGVQQKNISIAERGNGVTVLQATALQAGIYFYTLICDGNTVDTKQIILTK